MKRSLIALVVLVLLWSGISPHDRFTWFMEVFPVLIGLPVLVFWRRQLPFTQLVYIVLALHACILMVGGKYTYAEVPLGYWMESWFGFTRNNYDRIGHLAQGFVPAMVFRELLLRNAALKPGRWLTFLVFCCCMALSACYELLEWGTAVATGTAADAFLGTQGDVWDTQEDMMMAAIGAIAALVALSGVQDRLLSGERSTVNGER